MTETITAAALIKQGLCSALCLLAAHHDEAITCNCPCGGAYHAKFSGLAIELAIGHHRRPVEVLTGQLTFDLAGAA